MFSSLIEASIIETIQGSNRKSKETVFLVIKNSSNQLMGNKNVKQLQEAQSHTEIVQFGEQSVIFILLPCISESSTKQVQNTVLNSVGKTFVTHCKIL